MNSHMPDEMRGTNECLTAYLAFIRFRPNTLVACGRLGYWHRRIVFHTPGNGTAFRQCAVAYGRLDEAFERIVVRIRRIQKAFRRCGAAKILAGWRLEAQPISLGFRPRPGQLKCTETLGFPDRGSVPARLCSRGRCRVWLVCTMIAICYALCHFCFSERPYAEACMCTVKPTSGTACSVLPKFHNEMQEFQNVSHAKNDVLGTIR